MIVSSAERKTRDAAPQSAAGMRDPWAHWAWPLGVMALGALLRLYHLGAWNLVLDEGTSDVTAALPLTSIWGYIIRTDPFHPPLYHLVLHFWRHLGDSDFTLRLLSTILGTLSIWMLYRIGTYLVDRRAGLLAALILAISPFHIWYSQEARMYPMVFFLSLLSLDALVRIIKEGRTSQWLVYIAATTLSIYTDYGAILMLAAHNVAVVALLTRKQGPRLWQWMLAQVAILVLYLPWAAATVPLGFHGGRVPMVPAGTYRGSEIHGPALLQGPAWVLATFTSGFLPPQHPFLKIAVILVFGAVVATGIWALRRTTVPAIVLAAVAVVPIVEGVALSTKIGVLFPRMLITATAGYYLLMAVGFLAVPRRTVFPVLLGGLVAVNVLSLNVIYHTQKAPPWSRIAAHIAAEARPGDGLVFVDGRWRWVFGHYFHGPERVAVVAYVDRPDLETVLDFINAHNELYLVLYEETRMDPTARVRQYVQSRFARTERMEFQGDVVIERYHK